MHCPNHIWSMTRRVHKENGQVIRHDVCIACGSASVVYDYIR